VTGNFALTFYIFIYGEFLTKEKEITRDVSLANNRYARAINKYEDQ
jgi:hypothetical protein